MSELKFYEPPADDSEPFFTVIRASGAGFKNYCPRPQTVITSDIRGREAQFAIDCDGFMALSHVSRLSDFENRECNLQQRLSEWNAETTNLVEQTLKSEKVIVFDIALRDACPSEKDYRPVRKVHIDQSARGALKRAEQHLASDDYDAIVRNQKRFRIINVWRPIENTFRDHPLAFAQSQTVSDDDLIEVRHEYPDYVGETWAVRYNPQQRFWYWSDMSPSDVLFFTTFDNVRVEYSPLERQQGCAMCTCFF